MAPSFPRAPFSQASSGPKIARQVKLDVRLNVIREIAFALSLHPGMFFAKGKATRGEWASLASVIAVVIDAGDQLRVLPARDVRFELRVHGSRALQELRCRSTVRFWP
jgi:hypothetical protein